MTSVTNRDESSLAPRLIIPVETVLERMVTGNEDCLLLIAAFVDSLRPTTPIKNAGDFDPWQTMLDLLTSNQKYRIALRTTLLEFFSERDQRHFYADAGLLPNSGFFSELIRRLGQKILPELTDSNDLKDCINLVFTHKDDAHWLRSLPIEGRIAFWKLLEFKEVRNTPLFDTLLFQMLDSTVILAHRIAAMGLEPDLLRVNPRLAEGESPFIALSVETSQFAEHYRCSLNAEDAAVEDERHLLVLLHQCRQAVMRALQVATSQGTNMPLTFLMVRLSQHLDRLELLIQILAARFSDEAQADLAERWSIFFNNALVGERRRHSVLSLGSDLLSIIALRITENAGRTGEHYIAGNRSEWTLLWRSAAGAGLIIPIMALLKISGYSLSLAILNHGLLNGLIYAGGFVVIQTCHFTVATKQPAMTASTIAGTVNQAKGRLQDADRLIRVMIDTFRSQVAAIAGNVLTALLVATSLAMVTRLTVDTHLITSVKAQHLLHEIDPISGGTLFYAAIAGIWLFTSGIVSGYMDNLAAFSNIGDRISRHPWILKVAGSNQSARIGSYLHQNLGGLAGNIFFGLMLGVTPAVGLILGLPLDIRHVAFASANLGFSLTALDFSTDSIAIIRACSGVVLIGLVNLTVSFSLALWVAMRSRGADFSGVASLLPRIWQYFKESPVSFFIHPGEEKR